MGNNETLALGESGGGVARVPLRYLTRHGIIAGSTGSGKSRAMQVLAEQLADAGIPVFVSDVKGDASGFCMSGGPSERNRLAPYEPHALEADYWSVGGRFVPMRFSVDETGAVLFSRLLSLNPTQESHLARAFSHARKSGRRLRTSDDLLDVLDELVDTKQRGISPSSIAVIQRKIIALDESGLAGMFGEPRVKLSDLKGLNVLNLSDSRKNPISTLAPAFLLQKLFNELPEVGDVERPSFAIFFDEAHYLFRNANKSLNDLMATMLRQIRSKGVAVFFITQEAGDIPEEILGQLSTKIIFSQRVFTGKGTARLRALANSFPRSSGDVMEVLKTMAPGTALFSTLDAQGNQTPPMQVKIFAPASSMAVVPDEMLRKMTDPKLMAGYAIAKKAEAGKVKPAAGEAKAPATEKTQPKPAAAKTARAGPSPWDGAFTFLLKLLRFIINALGMVINAALVKPLKSLFRYLVKKPVRLAYFLLLLLLIYVIIINWALVSSLLARLKF